MLVLVMLNFSVSVSSVGVTSAIARSVCVRSVCVRKLVLVRGNSRILELL